MRLEADAETVPHIDNADDVAQVTAFFLAEVFSQSFIGDVAIAALAEAGQVFGPAQGCLLPFTELVGIPPASASINACVVLPQFACLGGVHVHAKGTAVDL